MSIRNINNSLLLLKNQVVRSGVSGQLESFKQEYLNSYNSKLGYSTTEEITGTFTLSIENDFTVSDIYGTAIAHHKEVLPTILNPKEVRSFTLSQEEFSLNYIGTPLRNASPSFATKTESFTSSIFNTKVSQIPTKERYMVEAVFVGAPVYYEVVLNYILSNGYEFEIEDELPRIQK